MSINYDHADGAALATLKEAMERYHEELAQVKLTVQVLMAFQYDDEGQLVQCLKHHGMPAAAKTSITSLADRVRGIEDAKIIIDRATWESMAETRRLALLDHELHHLMLVYDSKGMLKLDDHGRPKLRLRKHDIEITYFHDVAQRHNEASVEAAQVRHFNTEYGEQMLLFGRTEENK